MRERLLKGFTLIELLVVIAIIGILASMAYVSYVNSQLAARDTQRRSDLNQYRVKLEQYASTATAGLYPVYATKTLISSSNLCSVLNMVDFCLADPTPTVSGFGYYYISDTTGNNFKLWAKLEAVTNGYWEICSLNKSGLTTTHTDTVTCNVP